MAFQLQDSKTRLIKEILAGWLTGWLDLLDIFKADDLQASLKSHQATSPSCPTEQSIDGPNDPKLLSLLLLLLLLFFLPLLPLLLGCTKSKSTIRCLCALNLLTTCRVSGSSWQMSPYEVAAARYSCPRDILRWRTTSGEAEWGRGRLSWASAKVFTAAAIGKRLGWTRDKVPAIYYRIALIKSGLFRYQNAFIIEDYQSPSQQPCPFQFYL